MDKKLNLPVIIGMGGINCAGRTSGHHSYKRMLCDILPKSEMENTWRDLYNRMGLQGELNADVINAITNGTLIRKIESFDPNSISYHHKARLDSSSFYIKKSKLPEEIPAQWRIEEHKNGEVKVTISEPIDILLSGKKPSMVSSGGNIPTGFDPGKLYNSHHHPRGLKLTVYGASDALNSLGIEWEEILKHIKPDEVSVYASSAFAQVDEHSLSGLISLPLTGGRITSKMLALSLADMPADFINSYILNNVGTTGANLGACATFLYNLRLGVIDIQLGKAKVAIIGGAEAPVVPEVVEGFSIMGALATDEQLCALDNATSVNNRRACRPFSTNVGFTIAEAAQFIVLMNDELALKLGANILGSVADVFVNADANKKSIASPGIGNYVTMAKTTALAKAILGPENLQNTYVQAHGTGTPQNRVTESHILNETAKAFSIESWPVTAVKSYLGHSISAAAGDQLIVSLGVWRYGWLPGIKTIDHIASDVHHSHLNILTDHYFADESGSKMKAVIINSKGFGGNNATALVLSPEQTKKMLEKKYGNAALKSYHQKNEIVSAKSQALDLEICSGKEKITYQFGECIISESEISIDPTKISLTKTMQSIDLPQRSPYWEYNE